MCVPAGTHSHVQFKLAPFTATHCQFENQVQASAFFSPCPLPAPSVLKEVNRTFLKGNEGQQGTLHVPAVPGKEQTPLQHTNPQTQASPSDNGDEEVPPNNPAWPPASTEEETEDQRGETNPDPCRKQVSAFSPSTHLFCGILTLNCLLLEFQMAVISWGLCCGHRFAQEWPNCFATQGAMTTPLMSPQLAPSTNDNAGSFQMPASFLEISKE